MRGVCVVCMRCFVRVLPGRVLNAFSTANFFFRTVFNACLLNAPLFSDRDNDDDGDEDEGDVNDDNGFKLTAAAVCCCAVAVVFALLAFVFVFPASSNMNRVNSVSC